LKSVPSTPRRVPESGAASVQGESVRVRTLTLVLLLLLTVSFGLGVYEIHYLWAEHQGPHGLDGMRLPGLPEMPVAKRPHIRPGT
jgi:hypothetical protein